MMCEAVPDCLVTGYSNLIDLLELPDPDDRHVLAVAIHAGATAIVTDNLQDFPGEALRPFGIEAVSADEFAVRALTAAPQQVTAIVERQAEDLKNPSYTVDELIETFDGNGMRRFAARLRRLGSTP